MGWFVPHPHAFLVWTSPSFPPADFVTGRGRGREEEEAEEKEEEDEEEWKRKRLLAFVSSKV